MNHSCIPQPRNRYLFIFVVVLVYSAIFGVSDCLNGPLWEDENSFWNTSLFFGKQLIPSMEQIRNYDQLNTPLPFILFGLLEYIFHQGPLAARLVSFMASLGIVFLIGWPGKKDSIQPVFSVLGLFFFPFFLFLSTRLYSDILASFLGLLGLILYLRKRHNLSGIFFVLAIACRQFMVAFPLAIAAHELVVSVRYRQWPGLSFFLPVGSALSLIFWMILFSGLAPEKATDTHWVPEVQRSVFNFSLGGALFSLTTLGWAYVVPEFLLFKHHVKFTRAIIVKFLVIATIVIILFILSPPYQIQLSFLTNVTERLPSERLSLFLLTSLAILTCWRFSQVNLELWMIVCNAIIMMKAVPWDKYALPLIVMLWYLQSRNISEKSSLSRETKMLDGA